MGLTDADVREILRLIDESGLDELRVETDGFALHVRKDGAAAEAPAAAGDTIDSPMVGTFYRAPAPGEDPFVDVGSEVSPDTVVGLIEVMKMMNAVEAGVAGTIAEVCVENAELVEAGAPLFRIAT